MKRPYAVTHILVPILLVAIFRDFYLKKEERAHFPLHYVLIAGLGGVLPDIDIPISFILKYMGIQNWNIHQAFTHSLALPFAFFVLFLIFSIFGSEAKVCNLTRHRLRLNIIFLMLGIGALIHIALDASFPYFLVIFPTEIRNLIPPTLDGILLVIWIIYLELKHKISDFI